MAAVPMVEVWRGDLLESLHAGHAEVIPAAIAKKMDVVLVTYNFTMGERNDALMKSLHDAGVGVVAMKVMAGGRGPEAGTASPGVPSGRRLHRPPRRHGHRPAASRLRSSPGSGHR